MVREGQTWYMFFEVLNQQSGKGEIGVAVSEDGLAWTYKHIVLAEPFHLSYPYTFKHAGDYYMIPESWQAGAVRLYKAVRFPSQWVHVVTLLNGPYFADSSIVRYYDRWWLFTETNPEFKHDTLRLYHAIDLAGPWHEHPRSPIVDGDAHLARPAGRVLVENGRLVRYAQDDYPTYGRQVRAFEITEMTTGRYGEREVSGPVLTASGTGWNGYGMHHIDPHRGTSGRWMACVDGLTYD